MKKIILIGLLLILVGLSGCSCGRVKIDIEDYNDQLQEYSGSGVQECNRKGMDYAGVTMKNIGEWDVICFTKSPVKHYSFRIP